MGVFDEDKPCYDCGEIIPGGTGHFLTRGAYVCDDCKVKNDEWFKRERKMMLEALNQSSIDDEDIEEKIVKAKKKKEPTQMTFG